MKIIFFGTSNVALPALEALHAQHEVLAVVTLPDAKVGKKQIITETPVAVLATELKIKILKPNTLAGNSELENELKNLSPDIFIVISYGKIIPLEYLNLPPHKSLNIHPSLLPKYRGPTPIQTALLNGDTVTGTTIMQMDEKMDHGPILVQKQAPIEPDDTFTTLADKLARMSAALLIDTLPSYTAGTLSVTPQDEAQASVCKILSKLDGKIDWTKTAEQIYNQFRAYFEWPQTWTTWEDNILKVLECVPLEESTDAAPGTVLAGGKIACGQNTTLQINSLQLAGKNATDIKSFLNGYPKFTGSAL